MLNTKIAAAATATWTGLGGDPLWSNPVNWDIGGFGPGPVTPGDDLVFPATPFTLSLNDVAPGFPINTISLTGAGYVIAGLPILLISGITDISVPGGPNQIDVALSLGGSQNFTVASNLLIISGGVDLTGTTLNMDVTGTLDISSVISDSSGTGAITKSSSGGAAFSGGGANTYIGLTTVNDGELVLNKTGVTAIAGPLTIGDTVGANDSALAEELWADQIDDGSDVTIMNDGKLNLNGNNDGIDDLTMTGGNIATGAGTLTLNDNVTAGSATSGQAIIAGNLSLGGATRTFNLTNGDFSPDLSITANVSDGMSSAGIIVNGIEMQLSGTNTYTGTTTVNAGSLLTLGSDGALGATSAGTEVMDTGTLAIIGSRQ